MSFGFKVETPPSGVLLTLVGEIDERANFNKIELPEGRHLIIDLKGIKLLNSVGLRGWVLWVKDLHYPVITLRHCPAVAVHQMNILHGFLPLKATIESFEIPYHCDSCHHEESLWAQRGTHFFERTADKAEWFKVEESIKCPQCGEESILDVMPLKYFSFLKSHSS